MPYRQVSLLAGEYYHIYNRGNNYETIFRERENYLYFLRLVKKYLLPGRVEIIAYCLMPDHYHFLLSPQTDTLSAILQPLLLAYTHAFNRRYRRIGALFQGRFKARHIAKNEYLLHLSRYIHLNPVQAGLCTRAEDWEFSSYRDYLGFRQDSIIHPEIVLGQFALPEDYSDFVEESVAADWNGVRELLIDYEPVSFKETGS